METDKLEYLGDGLYAKFDGYHIVLMANDTEDPSDTVYLEYDVYLALKKFASVVFR